MSSSRDRYGGGGAKSDGEDRANLTSLREDSLKVEAGAQSKLPSERVDARSLHSRFRLLGHRPEKIRSASRKALAGETLVSAAHASDRSAIDLSYSASSGIERLTRRFGLRLTGLLTTLESISSTPLVLRLNPTLNSSISSSSSCNMSLNVALRFPLSRAGKLFIEPTSDELPLLLLLASLFEPSSTMCSSLKSRRWKIAGGVFCPACKARATVTGEGGTFPKRGGGGWKGW